MILFIRVLTSRFLSENFADTINFAEVSKASPSYSKNEYKACINLTKCVAAFQLKCNIAVQLSLTKTAKNSLWIQ